MSQDKRKRLARLEAAFEEGGGRGVELADEIDALRAELAEDQPRWPTIEVNELSADDCDALDLDETLRDTGGRPYVRVTVTFADRIETSYVGVLESARISPEHVQEV
jgi:hypothetical protein